MKITLAFALLCLTVKLTRAQENLKRDSLYVVTFTTGAAWDVAKAPQEQNYFKEHSANLSKLRKEGLIKLAARYADKGIIVVAASSILEARKRINSDPAVINKLFDADIQKLLVFYDGCMGIPK
jgi:uncharacterized protein YciI